MAKHKYTDEEVEQWEKDHHESVFYINKNDSNLFANRRFGLGHTVNLANPASWIIIAAVATAILLIIFHKQIFG